MAAFRWSYNRIEAWAVLGGKQFDVAGFQVDFDLNAIPRATVRLPLGRSATTGAASPIHAVVQSLVEQTPIQLWCRVGATAGDRSIRDLGVPKGAFLAFDGLTAGGGYTRDNRGAAQYQLSCNHWLVQLGQGSAFSATSHPGNPARYSAGAVTAGSGDTGAKRPNWTTLTGADASINAITLASDVWGGAFYPWFRHLADQDGFWAIERDLKGDATNKQALGALDRMGTKAAGYVASRLRSTLSIDVDIASEIAKDVVLLTSNPAFTANQTLWDILVGNIAPDYLLAVVPRVNSALVVPYIPGNRGKGGKPFAKVLADEYAGIQIESASRRPLRAFGILSSLATRTGADGFADDAPDGARTGIGGWYDTKKPGAVMIQEGRRWMAQIVAPSLAADPAGGVKPAGNAFAPGAGGGGGDGAGGGARDAAKERAVAKIKPLLDAYAKARYAQEVLQGRYGLVTGPLRLDVAPGSLVEIEGASEQFIADLDQFGLGYFGEVLRVSLAVDAEAATAGTSLHVGYVRTAAENGDDRTSVDGHPLYESTFQGSGLLDK